MADFETGLWRDKATHLQNNLPCKEDSHVWALGISEWFRVEGWAWRDRGHEECICVKRGGKEKAVWLPLVISTNVLDKQLWTKAVENNKKNPGAPQERLPPAMHYPAMINQCKQSLFPGFYTAHLWKGWPTALKEGSQVPGWQLPSSQETSFGSQWVAAECSSKAVAVKPQCSVLCWRLVALVNLIKAEVYGG